MFPAFGFGARIPPEYTVSEQRLDPVLHCGNSSQQTLWWSKRALDQKKKKKKVSWCSWYVFEWFS